MGEKVIDHHRQIAVWLHQTRSAGNDAVPVVVGVAGENDREAVPVLDHAVHRIGRRRVHADAPVPVERHEAKGRVDLGVEHRQLELVALADGGPVVHAGTAQRVDAHVDFGTADRCHVDHAGKVFDVIVEEVVAMRGRCFERLRQRHPLHAGKSVGQHRVGCGLDRRGDVGAGRPPVRRVVFEAATLRRVVRGRDHDAVGQPAGSTAVVDQYGVRHGRRRRVLVIFRQHQLDAIRGQHFDRARKSRCRQCMRVDTEEQRAVDALLPAKIADRLGDRQHVPLVERIVERRAAVARSAEGDALRWHRRIGATAVVGRDESRHIDQRSIRCRLAGEGADLLAHVLSPVMFLATPATGSR